MANDPRDLSGARLQQALAKLGQNTALRAELMAWLKAAEHRIDYPASVRDDITGPIIDALHSDHDVYEKTLADGTRFQFLFRTKIARDFLLSEKEHPSHVWEPQTTRILKHLAGLTQGDILIGGAYFGDHAILLGRQLQGSGRLVHCFEPNPDQSVMLAKNAGLNQLDNLRLQKFGLWHESSQHLRLDGFDSFANAVVSEQGEGSFETVSIDDYCKAQGRTLSIIMIDIEGAEYNALRGAAATLKQDRPAIVYEVHRDYVDWSNGLPRTPICELLADLGYSNYAIRDFNTNQEMEGKAIELVPAATVYLEGPPHGFNMLALPDQALLQGGPFRIVDHVSPKLLRHKDPALHHPLDGIPAFG